MTRTLLGSPPLESAMTFQSDRFGSLMAWTLTVRSGLVPGTYSSKSWVPIRYVVKMTGMCSVPARLPEKRPARPGLPSLKMTAAEAPAASAFATFGAKVQVPRWIRAMLPAVNPAKSEAAQPLAELGAGVAGTTMPPAGWSFAVTEPTTCPGLNSVPIPKLRGVGEFSWNTGVPTKLKYGNLY